MMQMQITLLKKYAEMRGVPWRYHMIDAKNKDEYYGKTQQKYRAQLLDTLDVKSLNLVYFDDVDLLIPGRQAGNINSADQDILKLFMDYLAGVDTIFRGNTISIAATNNAVSMDPAFRQRMKGRYSIDGPTKPEHYSLLFKIKFKHLINNGIINLSDGNGFDQNKVAKETGLEYHLSSLTTDVLNKMGKSADKVSWNDVGQMAYEYKQKDERFTGGFIDNVVSNVLIYFSRSLLKIERRCLLIFSIRFQAP